MNTDNILVRRMRPQDIAGILQIEVENGLSSWGCSGYELELSRNDALLLVAVDKAGEQVGILFGRILGNEFELFNLAVIQKFHRKGIATKLLQHGISELSQYGVVTIFLEVRLQNRGAREFYEKYGFKKIGERIKYYSSPPDDAVLMSFDIEARLITGCQDEPRNLLPSHREDNMINSY